MSGSSWKPLPVLFTTPFSVFGDAAPQLWVLVVRAGALLAVLFSFRGASRLAGTAAGVAAAGGRPPGARPSEGAPGEVGPLGGTVVVVRRPRPPSRERPPAKVMR